MKKSVGITILLVLSMVLSAAAFGQEPPRKMRQEIVKLKYIDSEEIRIFLSTFLSPYGRISPIEKSGFLTISDIPENVEKILAVIRELDVKPADIQFTIQLVLASTGEEPGKSEDQIKDDPLIKELRGLLNFKYFYPLDSSFVRALDREYSEVTMGREAELLLDLQPKYIKEDKEDFIQVEARLRKREFMPKGEMELISLLTSNFTMRSGDKTVVGVSKLDGGDKGLILIITGKIVR